MAAILSWAQYVKGELVALDISFLITSQTSGQSYNCLNTNESTPKVRVFVSHAYKSNGNIITPKYNENN